MYWTTGSEVTTSRVGRTSPPRLTRRRTRNVAATFDEFERKDVEPDAEVDSLIRRHQRRADSLRRHCEQMERQMLEQLRKPARHLREQAELLEERAEEMEGSSPSKQPEIPDHLSAPSDGTIGDVDGFLSDQSGATTLFSERLFKNGPRGRRASRRRARGWREAFSRDSEEVIGNASAPSARS